MIAWTKVKKAFLLRNKTDIFTYSSAGMVTFLKGDSYARSASIRSFQSKT